MKRCLMRADIGSTFAMRAHFSHKKSLPSGPVLVADAPVQFSAVLLAGGKSSRMGRDKAALVVDGVPLWQRQLATLRAAGAREVFVSGAARGPWTGMECIHDEVKGAGPLA